MPELPSEFTDTQPVKVGDYSEPAPGYVDANKPIDYGSTSDKLSHVVRAVPDQPPEVYVHAANSPNPTATAQMWGGLNICKGAGTIYKDGQAYQPPLVGLSGFLSNPIGDIQQAMSPTYNPAFGSISKAASEAGSLTYEAAAAPVSVGAGLLTGAMGKGFSKGFNAVNSNASNIGSNVGKGAADTVVGGASTIGSGGASLVSDIPKFIHDPIAEAHQLLISDPWNTAQTAWNPLPRLWRYNIEYAHRYGNEAALAHFAGTILPALAFMATGQEEGAAGGLEADAGDTASLTSRLADLNPKTQAAYNAVKAVTDSPVGKVAGAPLRAVGTLNDFVQKGFPYLASGMMGASSGVDRDLWDKSANGSTWIDPNTGVHATMGQSVISMVSAILGNGYHYDPHNALESAASGTVDFTSQFVMPDALAGAGDVYAQARSAEGAGGLLHSLWSGTAIRSGDDIPRIAAQYPQFRHTMQWIADHTPGEVARVLDGRVQPTLIKELGNARTYSQVQAVLEDAADANAALTYRTLAVGGYTRFKSALRNVTDMDKALEIGHYPYGSKQTLYSKARWGAADANRAMLRIFTKQPFAIDETGNIVKNAYRTSEQVSVKSFANVLRSMGANQRTIDMASESINEAKIAGDQNGVFKAMVQSIKDLVGNELDARLPDPAFDYNRDLLKKILAEQVQQTMLSNGPGEIDLYGTGELGLQNSMMVDPVSLEPRSNSAITSSQLFGIVVPDSRSIRTAIRHAVDIAYNKKLTSMMPALELATKDGEADIEGIEQMAMDRGVTVETVTHDIDRLFADKPQDRSEMLSLLSQAQKMDPENTVARFRQFVSTMSKEDSTLEGAEASLNTREASLMAATIDTKLVGGVKVPWGPSLYDPAARTEAAEKAYRDAFTQKVSKFLEHNWRTGGQQVIDGANNIFNNLFLKPMTLSSPSWAFHVSLSEAMLNVFRYGPMHMFEAHFASEFAQKALKYSLNNEAYTPNKVRDAVGGVLLGLREAGLNAVMGEDKARRLISDAMDITMLHPNGIAPALSAVHTAYAPGVADEPSLDNTPTGERVQGEVEGAPGEATWKRAAFGKKFEPYIPGKRGYINAWQHLVGAAFNNEESRILAQLFRDEIDGMGQSAFLRELRDAREGVIKGNPLDTDYNAPVIQRIVDEMEHHINVMPQVAKDAFNRSKGITPIGAQLGLDPERDWARVQTYNMLHSFLGQTYNQSHDEFILDQIINSNTKPLDEWAAYTHKFNNHDLPASIPGPAIMKGSGYDVWHSLQRMSDWSHRKFLGPLVDEISRRPTYLLAYHEEMELLRPMIAGKAMRLTEDQAQVLAQTRAARKMIGEVHNPLDKTNLENALRVAAPFYFAQNQAWRRAFRLLSENPGAFEQYMKLCLGVTNWASQHMVNGIPMVTIPVSEWIGNMFGVHFGMAGDLSSLKSTTLTGMNGGGWQGLVSDLAPQTGPVVNIPLTAATGLIERFAGAELGEKGILAVKQIVSDVEGPIGANETLWKQLLPNSLLSSLAEGAENLANQGATGSDFGNAEASARLQVFKQLVQQYEDSTLQEMLKHGWNGFTPKELQAMYHNPADQMTLAAWVQAKMAQDLNPSTPQGAARSQDMMNRANLATAAMWAAKTAMSFFGPVSTTLEQGGQIAAKNTQLQNDINQLGVEAGMQKFEKANPFDVENLLSGSTSPYGVAYPETMQAYNMLQQYSDIAERNQNAFAFYIPNPGKSAFDYNAYAIEMTMGLRTRNNMDDLKTQFMLNAGNAWYYGPNGPYEALQKNPTYNQRMQIEAGVKNYARNYNPTWGFVDDPFNQIDKSKNTAWEAYQGIQQFEKDAGYKDFLKTAPEQTKQIASGIQQMTQYYHEYTKAYTNAATSTERYQLQSTWYNACQAVVKDYSYMGPVINGVFVKLPGNPGQ